MKTYSDDAVTRTDLEHLDATQTREIKQLRIWLAVSFATNILVSVGLFFLR